MTQLRHSDEETFLRLKQVLNPWVKLAESHMQLVPPCTSGLLLNTVFLCCQRFSVFHRGNGLETRNWGTWGFHPHPATGLSVLIRKRFVWISIFFSLFHRQSEHHSHPCAQALHSRIQPTLARWCWRELCLSMLNIYKLLPVTVSYQMQHTIR